MARTIQTRKRSGGILLRPIKKRRTIRRRRRNVSGRTTTSRASGATSIGTFKGRKTTLRQYRNILWRDSMMKTHWRSVFDAATNITTPNNLTSGTLAVINALPIFYTTGGGAVSADSGVAVPTFNGDIILRGGIARIAIANRVAEGVQPTDNVRVTVYACWTTATPSIIFPAAVPTMWDPSLLPDFEKFGKVLWKREALLKADGEAVQIYFKFKVQKIDQAVFTQGSIRGQTLVWVLHVSQTSNSETTAIAEIVDVVTSHNLSFTGDAT